MVLSIYLLMDRGLLISMRHCAQDLLTMKLPWVQIQVNLQPGRSYYCIVMLILSGTVAGKKGTHAKETT